MGSDRAKDRRKINTKLNQHQGEGSPAQPPPPSKKRKEQGKGMENNATKKKMKKYVYPNRIRTKCSADADGSTHIANKSGVCRRHGDAFCSDQLGDWKVIYVY